MSIALRFFPALRRICLACLLLPAITHPAAAQSSIDAMRDAMGHVQEQERARKLNSPPFDAGKWAQLKVGMSPQAVYDLLGAPSLHVMRNGGEGRIETTWTYVFDKGATEKEVRFGVPIPPGTQVTQGTFAGGPEHYATADLAKLGMGDVFDWSGREAAASGEPPPPAGTTGSSPD